MKELKTELDLSMLDEVELKIVKSNFDYLLNLEYFIDAATGEDKRELQMFKEKYILHITIMIDVFETRNAMKKKGILL